MTDLVDKRRNSFNAVRLLAALNVLYGHARVHLNMDYPNIINQIVSLFQGVPIFFILSGFLIWNSVNNSRCFAIYFRKRILRIYPELWMAVAVNLIVMVVLNGGGGGTYNWIIMGLFTITQATVFQFWTPNVLRGYGCGTPNGALWTITIIVQFYIVVWILHKIYIKYKRTVIIVALFSVIVGLFSNFVGEGLLGKLYNQTVFPYMWIFMIGVVCMQYFDRIINVLKKYGWVALIISFVFCITKYDINCGGYTLFKCLFLGIGIIGMAYRVPVTIKHDISYGIYLYHMIVVNAMIQMGLIGERIYLLIVLIVSIIFAIASSLIVNRYIIKK